MSYENFNTYIEDDPLNHISKTVTQITVTNMTDGEEARVYKDYGTGFFGAPSVHMIDFQHLGGRASVGIYALSNYIGDIDELLTYPNIMIYSFYSNVGEDYELVLWSRKSDLTAYSDYMYNLSTSTIYYLTITRTETDVTVDVYSDSNRTNLINSLQVAMDTTTFRYVYATVSRSAGGSNTVSAEIYNLDLGIKSRGAIFSNVQSIRSVMGI